MNRLAPTFIFVTATNVLGLGLSSLLGKGWVLSPVQQNRYVDYLTASILGLTVALLALVLLKGPRPRYRRDLCLFVPLTVVIGLLGGMELGLFGSAYRVTQVSSATCLVLNTAAFGLTYIVTQADRTPRTGSPIQFLMAATIFVILAKVLGIQSIHYVPDRILAFLPRLLNLNAALALVFACVAMLDARLPTRELSSPHIARQGDVPGRPVDRSQVP